ncbi:MAG TPA: hypothetical protein VGB18_01780 [Candidatus Thermoplasmatota archaeon]
MNPEVKRRIVMSLVSLALAFGLLATYYIVTVPWNRTAVGQALTAGALLGIAALVIRFLPIRAPVPVVSTDQTAEPVPVPNRSWQPEPDFAAEDFQADLAGSVAPSVDPSPTLAVPVPAAARVATVAKSVAVEPIHSVAADPITSLATHRESTVVPHVPEHIVPKVPSPALHHAAMTPETLEKVIEAADNDAQSDALRFSEIIETSDVMMSRNDHVRIDATVESPALPPVVVRSRSSQPARITATPAPVQQIPANSPVPAALKPVPVAKAAPSRPSPKSEWREPDPETPKELLRELAEYWHVKYETERKRHGDMLSEYEDVVRRLEVLETRTAEPMEPEPRAVAEQQVPLDEMSVADALVKEGKDELEERWDRRTAQMERFH